MAVIENLKLTQEYSIKMVGKARKAKYYFEGYRNVSNTDVMVFKSKSNTLYLTSEHIESIEEAQTKVKTKKVTCPKCAGEKYFVQYTNNRGGICFTCEGKGYILK